MQPYIFMQLSICNTDIKKNSRYLEFKLAVLQIEGISKLFVSSPNLLNFILSNERDDRNCDYYQLQQPKRLQFQHRESQPIHDAWHLFSQLLPLSSVIFCVTMREIIFFLSTASEEVSSNSYWNKSCATVLILLQQTNRVTLLELPVTQNTKIYDICKFPIWAAAAHAKAYAIP